MRAAPRYPFPVPFNIDTKYSLEGVYICCAGMQTLQDHFGEAMAAQGRGDSTAAALHNGVVTAAIGVLLPMFLRSASAVHFLLVMLYLNLKQVSAHHTFRVFFFMIHRIISCSCATCLTAAMCDAEAVQAYLEWAPLGRVGASGLLSACAYLLTVPSHRMGSCGMLRQVSQRRQLQVRSCCSDLT